MWVYLERGATRHIIEALLAAGRPEIAAVLEEQVRLEAQDSEVDARYRRAARELYGEDGELEFDPSAVVSKGDDPGAYVMGWRWVADVEIGLASDNDVECADQ